MKFISLFVCAVTASAVAALNSNQAHGLETIAKNCKYSESNTKALIIVLSKFAKEANYPKVTELLDAKNYKEAAQILNERISTLKKDAQVQKDQRYEVGFVKLRRCVESFAEAYLN
ncbi:hypothetical protein BX661DRAFT_49536 [Kickxella alabastrina]|uniref:uncharacterized protein n=1 Tax=Kickxella alabastrina TaxID=61397 RepID=UPI0022208544|nr:uncharacterized protein BX661DRAFT_49536 [Kickxella alabastrina]KAI7834118.1 hypothetical protein BX661DRAFT_49536 [Kickxella alabastrina]